MVFTTEHKEIMAGLIRDEIEVLEFLLNENNCELEDRELNEIRKLELEDVLGYFI